MRNKYEITNFHSKKPNVIIIFMDDMGYGDPVCYGGGPYQTPNMDALAAQGVRFTEFYAAQAVCTASRGALLTGCYPTRIGLYGAIGPSSDFALNPKEETIAELLKNNGYKTGIVGKWHLGFKPPYLPLQNGFDEFYGLPYSNDMWPVDVDGLPFTDTSNWRSKQPPLPLLEGNKTVKIISTLKDQDQLTGHYTQKAISFIQRNKSRPFFLYMAHSMPHVPLGASDKFKGKSGFGLFGDVMQEVDWSVGQILKTIQENGLQKNTIVILASDNGPWLSYGNHAGSAGGHREGKGSIWDGGLKVPCIISWPGHIKPGTVCNKLLSTIDILPTLVSICNAKAPTNKIDGINFEKLLLGDNNITPRDEFVYYYDRNNLKAIRKGIWKLVFAAKSQTYNKPNAIGQNGYSGVYSEMHVPLALYNLSNDPGEERDLKKEYPDIIKKLNETANKYRSSLGDGLTNTVGKEVRPAAIF